MPIARREMLVLARSPLTYRVRLTTGLVTVVGGIAFALFYSRVGVGSVFPFIGVLGYMLSMMCMFSGAQVSADAISKEKREGTLGLLFLTGLPAWQITFGKLVATGLSAFFGVLVTFPLLSLLLICGGVLPGEIFQICIALLNTLFVSAAMGLLISTFSLEQKRAAGRASLMVVFLWWGLPMLARINLALTGPKWLSELFFLFSLNSSFLPSMVGVRFGASNMPWLNLFCLHLLGWVFLGLATSFVPRQWQDKPERPRLSPRAWWKRLSFGSEKVRRRLRQTLLEPNPFLWLASRDRLRFLGGWIITILMLGLGAFVYDTSGRSPDSILAFTVGMTLVHRFMTAGAGAAQLMVEQEQGTLEMLLSTPLKARDVLRGQFRATVRQLRGPVLLVILLHFFTGFLIFTRTPPVAGEMKVVIVLSLALYLIDLYAAIWLSMWGAVNARNPKQAGGAAIVRLIGLPFFVTAVASVIISILNAFFGFRLNPGFLGVFLFTCVLILANDAYWVARARRELPGRLRTYAYRRYELEEDKGLLSSLGRALGRIYGGMRTSKSASVTAR